MKRYIPDMLLSKIEWWLHNDLIVWGCELLGIGIVVHVHVYYNGFRIFNKE